MSSIDSRAKMTNPKLVEDYKKRAKGRSRAIQVLFKDGLYADVVRECQEACELALKSIIRESGHSVPMSHDVSSTLASIEKDLPSSVQAKLSRLCEISKHLRRDRELAFYGSEDITPSEFYEKKDADEALKMLKEVIELLG